VNEKSGVRRQKAKSKKKKLEVEEDRSQNGKRKVENVFLLTPDFSLLPSS